MSMGHAMENKWPVNQNQPRKKWNDGTRSQEVMRSRTYIEWSELHRSLPQSQPIGLVQSAYIACLLRSDDTKIGSGPASHPRSTSVMVFSPNLCQLHRLQKIPQNTEGLVELSLHHHVNLTKAARPVKISLAAPLIGHLAH